MALFRRKKKGPAADLRKEYRREPEKKHALGVKLMRASGGPVSGEVTDLSAGGTGVMFPTGRDPEVEKGDVVLLTFTSLVHGGEVQVEAQMCSRHADPEGTRYGFEFLDREKLFSQLDAYYFKFFNRRRARRVWPALDAKFSASLVFGLGSMEVRVSDISPDGLGVVLKAEAAQMLEDVGHLRCVFTLPREKEQLSWEAQAVHLSPLAQGVSFGVVFLLPDDPVVTEQRQLLIDYCGSRLVDMARWDQGSSS